MTVPTAAEIAAMSEEDRLRTAIRLAERVQSLEAQLRTARATLERVESMSADPLPEERVALKRKHLALVAS